MNATVRDVMTTRVVTVRRDTAVKDIAALLAEHRVSAFPVLDEVGKVIGAVSQADLLTKEALVAALGGQAVHPGRDGSPWRNEFARPAAITAADLMTKPPIVVTPDEPVTSATRLMYQARVKRLPVVTDDGRLAGIISRADVLSVYSRPDEEIRREITENVILNQFLAGPRRLTVTVSGGIVTLEGHPGSAARGRELVAGVWQVEGVVSVRDRLTYPEGR
jgi:CBS domain-containing protein